MSEHDEDMWNDYDHFQNTGEPDEFGEDFDEGEEVEDEE